jgi:hypothetical protein
VSPGDGDGDPGDGDGDPGDGDGDPGDGDGDGNGDGDGDGDPGPGDGDPGDGDGDGDGDLPPGIDCESVSLLGDPIEFDDANVQDGSRTSAAPVIWRSDIDELIVARSDSLGINMCNVIVEHRDTDGSLLDAPSMFLLDSNSAGCQRAAALAYNEDLDMYMYAYEGIVSNAPRLWLSGFDDSGTELWNEYGPHVCGSEQQSVDIEAVGDRFYLMGEERHCGSSPRRVYVSAWDAAGTMTDLVHTISGSLGGGGCLDATCTTALSVRRDLEPPMDLENGIQGTWGRDFDLGAWTLGNNVYNMGPSSSGPTMAPRTPTAGATTRFACGTSHPTRPFARPSCSTPAKPA